MSSFWNDVLYGLYIIGIWEFLAKPAYNRLKYPYRWTCSACPTRLRSNTKRGLHLMKASHLRDHGFFGF